MVGAAMVAVPADAEVRAATTLAADPMTGITTVVAQDDTLWSLSVDDGFGATLTGPAGEPITGRTVTFSAGDFSCDATTDLRGHAGCRRERVVFVVSTIAIVADLGYTASFVGDATYVGSTDRASVVSANGMDIP